MNHIFFIIIISCVTHYALCAEILYADPWVPANQVFFHHIHEKNKCIGNIDKYLLTREILRNKEHVYRHICNSCYVTYDGIKKEIHPFYITDFNACQNDPRLSEMISPFIENKTTFMSNNELNRKFSHAHPEVIPIDECTYFFKGPDNKINVICCFFDQKTLFELFKELIQIK